jgi:hypothetical protein
MFGSRQYIGDRGPHDRHDPPKAHAAARNSTGRGGSPIRKGQAGRGIRAGDAAGAALANEEAAMMLGWFPEHDDSRSAWPLQIDWKSAITGGVAVIAVAYGGLVAPAGRQVAALERHVSQLSAAVAALNESRDGVTRATTLLERLEAQASRLAASEDTISRFEALAERLAAQAATVETANATLNRLADLHGAIVTRGDAVAEAERALGAVEALTTQAAATRDAARDTAAALADIESVHEQLDAAAPVVERMTGLTAALARQADESTLASQRLEGLMGLEDRLVRTATDLPAADAALLRLTDLAASLADASGTVGQLQRFVVDVMLLEPAIGRAVRALEPVIDFTRAGRRVEPRTTDGAAADEVSPPAAAAVARATDEKGSETESR